MPAVVLEGVTKRYRLGDGSVLHAAHSVSLAIRERSRTALAGPSGRVAIARALMVRPSLLLADEPTGNPDSVTSDEIIELLTRVQQQFEATPILATHDHGVAASCDEVVPVHDGRARTVRATQDPA